jgi:ubiquinone/menaquinone biosynthesis C-methylase UbiE
MGLERQYVVDVRRWAKVPAINAVIKHLQTDPPSGAVRVPQRLIRDDHLEADLGQYYGISYRAPADARKLPVQDNFFDLIATTSTLEHIPPAVIRPILAECCRVLRPGGLMSHVIDYSDHYAHSDASITEYNYLRFDEQRWRKVNPSIHFQNRLRTKAYEQLFTKAGFELVEAVTWNGADEDLARVPVNDMFQNLSREEMLELGGNFLLRKP